MTQVLDPATMIEAAQTAAAAADYSAAERLLREAAAVQEATLGPLHPDLASTLNNLALVYEQTNKIEDAEQSYRRAHAIAIASLRPGHRFIATSLKNLVDFCEARDIPLWRPPATPLEDELSVFATEAALQSRVTSAPIDPTPAIDVMLPPNEMVTEIHHAPAAFQYSGAFRTIGLASLAVVVIVVGSLAMRSSGASPASSAPASSTAAVAPTVTASPAPAIETTRPPAIESTRDVIPAPVERPDARDTRVTPASVTVLTAQLCSRIEKQGSPDWQCASVGDDLRSGSYVFYTRVLTNADTTVEHRWYHDDRVHQVIRLRIAANASSGYRTFSSTTISPERAGNWRVEVRAADGTLLQEQQFLISR